MSNLLVPGVRRYTAVEALGISARRATIEEYGDDAAAHWLRQHDPRLSPDGVKSEIEDALASDGLTLDEARTAFRKGGGKPSRALVLLRGRVRAALMPAWADDRRRDYMAQALGCDRKTLRRLMA